MMEEKRALVDENKPAMTARNHRVMHTLAVTAVCYFSVSGGAIGSEPIFSAGGPLVGLITLVVFPFMWCIPTALITAELSTAFAENGGFTIWVYHAFGAFWAFQVGYIAWLAYAIDNAIYPALAIKSITKILPVMQSWNSTTLWFMKCSIALLFAIPNMMGVKLVGRGAQILSVIVTVPFVVFTIWGFASARDWSVLGVVRHNEHGETSILWSSLFSKVYWNYNGFASISTFAGEVHNPGTTFPRALALTVLAVMLTYILPLSAGAVHNEPSWTSWDEGSFNDLAKSMGGQSLSALITIATVASNWGQCNSDMLCATFQLSGMADIGLAPHLFSYKTSTTQVPYVAVALSCVILVVLVGCDFDTVLSIVNLLSALAQVIILLAGIKLRSSMPDLHRPYRVPGNTVVLVAWTIMPLIVAGYFIYSTIMDDDATVLLGVTGMLLFGVLYAWGMNFTSNYMFHHEQDGRA